MQLHYTHSLTLLFSRHCSDQPETHCWVMSDCECGNGAAPESAPESSNNIFDRRLQGGGCAGTGKVSEECGASGNGVKATCCEGLVCAGPPSPTTECQPPSPTPPPTVAATPPPTDAPTSPLTAPVSWCHDDPPCYIMYTCFYYAHCQVLFSLDSDTHSPLRLPRLVNRPLRRLLLRPLILLHRRLIR